jgi:hypothetical protein
MSDQEAFAGRLQTYEDRWTRAWEAATLFEQRRYRSLNRGDRFYGSALVCSGEVGTLGEAIKVASGGFEEFIQRRDGGAQRNA